jgi:hypothetical protein
MLKPLFAVGIILILFFSALVSGVFAQNQGIVLRAQQPWENYGVGTTCISGSSNLFAADVDGDGVAEILTGGFMYNLLEGSRSPTQAPLMIWTWNGQEVTLELSYKWSGNIRAVYASDLNGNGKTEIITAGTYRNETGSYNSLRLWHWNNEELSLVANHEGVAVTSLHVFDVNGDGVLELITVGRLQKESVITSRLTLWKFTDNLEIMGYLDLDSANVTSANSVFADDLDNNGQVEIVVAGYSDALNNSKGQVSIWHWKDNGFVLKANKQWQIVEGGYALTIAGGVQGNTIVNNVKAADLNGDAKIELVTGGFAWDGERVVAQIKILSWDGFDLAQIDSREWSDDYLTEVKCISLSDVNGDGKINVASSGTIAAAGSFNNASAVSDRGQLRVWEWADGGLDLLSSVEWSIDDGVCAWNLAAFDVDGSGDVEMVTVGCVGNEGLCDPNMRLWSLPQANSSSNVTVYLLIGVLIAVVFIGVLLVWRKTSTKRLLVLG